MSSSSIHAVKASLLHCTGDPDRYSTDNIVYVPDGVMLIENGIIKTCGTADTTPIPEHASVSDFTGKLVIPGFVDTHVHYPQLDMIAAYGTQLLEWLERYTFPAEAAFCDKEHATNAASFFLDQLLTNGTTTAMVFGTVHPESVNAFFNEAHARNLRMICGKVMMDRNAPQNLLDTPEGSYQESQQLIDRWHEKGRLGYAVTPRFAPTSTAEQLRMAGRLLDENPGVHLHTHMAENADECDWVASLFPDTKDYLAVYEQFGLVRKRSMFAHAIHLSDNAWKRLAMHDASVSHCPCSNLFIGSGLFDLRSAQKHQVRVGLGTDIGAGDNVSLLRVVNEAYKVQQLQRHTLTPEHAFYLATLGGARALDLDTKIGSFEAGKEADFLVIDEQATPLLARRTASQKSWQDRLFSVLMLGDDRCIEQTWIMGKHYPTAASILR